GAFPQLRMVGLAECGTHALVDVAVGPLAEGEQTLAARVLRALAPGMLLAADRGFFSFELWTQAAQTGAELLWRAKANQNLAVEEVLEDGSYLSRVYEDANGNRRGKGVPVRVIVYTIDDPGRPQAEDQYRLLTTILAPGTAPADELARLYDQRWEFESLLDELKTHQRGARVVLRSKLPEGVLQELYGMLCVHFAIRWLMHTVALDVDEDPDRLSFIHALRVARRTTASLPGFSPSDP
ncbi:MAG TPA: IS4 family transposase, partial [Actinomycetota bacterium]|nr:IS4 family transposase [Actinomycetota bacterium]